MLYAVEVTLNQNKASIILVSLYIGIVASKIFTKSSNKLNVLYRNARNFNLTKKKRLISALFQCHFYYTCSAWYSGLSKMMKCRMQMPHRGSMSVGLLPVEYRIELKLYNVRQ